MDTLATLDTLWEDLLAVALVGTERRPYTPPPGLLSGLRPADPAHAWLAAAGALTVQRLAGGQPARLPLAVPEPCPADEWPRCRPAAARHLSQMLSSQFTVALPEWLAAAAAAQQRVPEEHLPELLDWGCGQPALQAQIATVIGRRGQWLARQNPRWAYAVPRALPGPEAGFDALVEVWELAAPGERLALLTQLRAADPAAGLALVQHTWLQEKHDDRLAFVGELAVGLSQADESFLESLLDSRAAALRQAAARLLGRLPEAGLCQRMRKRARPLLRLEGGARGSARRRGGPSLRLMVNLPETCDAGLQRDGLTPHALPSETDRARWLAQIIGAVPPAEWTSWLGQEPAQLAVLARASLFDFALVEGWSAAAVAFGDAGWAEALLRERLPELNPAALAPLLCTLPPARRESLVYAALGAVDRLALRQPGLRLLQAYAEPWSARLTHLFVDKLRDELGRRDVPFGPTVEPGWLISAALYWEPGVVAEAAPLLRAARQAAAQSGGWMHWLHTVDQALALCEFRRALLAELVP